MANQTIIFVADGLPTAVSIKPIAGGPSINGSAILAVTGRDGWYESVFAAAVGDYSLHALDGSTPIMCGIVNDVLNNGGTFYEAAIANAQLIPGLSGGGGGGGGEVTGFTADALTEIGNVLRAIRVGASFPPFQGQPRRLIRGDDFLTANGTALPFTITNASGLADMSGWSVYLKLIVKTQIALSSVGTITSPTGSTRAGAVDWENLASDLPLGQGLYRFVFVDAAGHEVSLIEGLLELG